MKDVTCLGLLWLFWWACPAFLWAQTEGQVADRTSDWLYFDADQERYVPFLPEIQGAQPALHLRLDTSPEPEYHLLIRLDSGVVIFRDNDLYAITRRQGYFSLSPEEQRATKLLSIWRKGIRWQAPPPTTVVQNPLVSSTYDKEDHTAQKKQVVSRKERPTWIPDSVVLLTWGMLFFVVGLQQGERSIFRWSNFEQGLRALYAPLTEEQRLDTITGVSFFLYYTSTLAYFLTVWQAEFSQLLTSFVDYALLVMLYVGFRLVLLGTLSRIYFADTELVSQHLRELIRLSLPFTAILLITGVLLGLGQGGFVQWLSPEVFRWELIVLLLARTFLLCYQIFRLQKTVNFYLFSYLCSTEILPAFFVMRYVLNL